MLNFLKEERFDVACLQEVPIGLVDQFLALAPYSHVANEYYEYTRNGRVDHLQLVILSWLPIKSATAAKHKDHKTALKKYRKFDLEYQSVVVRYQKDDIRIHNVHFKCVAGPTYRLDSLQEVIDSLPSTRRSIICGDFNTIGRIWTNVFLYKIFKYSKSEIFLNEYTALSEKLTRHNYHNAFAGMRTFAKMPLQLDYILASKDLLVLERMRYKKRYGSDHYPILALIAVVE